jgi:HlyD family secretion protein
MTQDLRNLRIDRSLKATSGDAKWSGRWIVAGVLLFLLLGSWVAFFARAKPVEVQTARAVAVAADSGASSGDVVLNATGYIVAHHKIQLASKVIGKVAWIGVEKGDRVQKGQVIVRLEDDEYRAQLQQAKGNLAALEARLLELRNGSRPEEIQVAKANLDAARAELQNSKVNHDRVQRLVAERVMAQQALDDARARLDSDAARAASLERTFELIRIGPRHELIQQVQGQIEQAKGQVAFFETQLANTVIRAPVTGTILERAVEQGEFVTTSFVGERGAKGYVVSLADLNDLQVELDISQNDFGKLSMGQRGVVTTDTYKDRKWDGVIEEMSPEANRQKATVQVKVKVVNPDQFLRPEMNASVAFLAERKTGPASRLPARPAVIAPAAAVQGDTVFIVADGKAILRRVKTSGSTQVGVRVEEGLIGGEDLILDPPAGLKSGAEVRKRITK